MKYFYTSILWLVSLLLVFSYLSNQRAYAQLEISASDSIVRRDVIPGQYIVVYKKNGQAAREVNTLQDGDARKKSMESAVSRTLQKNNLRNKKLLQSYETILQGFAVAGLSANEVESLRQDPEIAYVEQDTRVQIESISQTTAAATTCESFVEINGVKNLVVGLATFGLQSAASGQLVLASPVDGCSALSNIVAGKIVLIDRSANCDYSTQVYNAQLAGAIGVIIANNVAGNPSNMGVGSKGNLVTIPSMSISQQEGVSAKAALAAGSVTASIMYMGNTQCTPWGITRVGGGLSGAGKRAWILDTGIDLDHPDLNVNVVLSRSFVTGVFSPDDEYGHGTHVAGTVAALDNAIGVIGVAAGAEVVSVRVLNAQGQGQKSEIIAGLNYIASSPSLSADDVVNISLGGMPSDAEESAVVALAAKCKVVVAAGNSRRSADLITPARVIHPNVYTVSAMGTGDIFASFSHYGLSVSYCAPGVAIPSTWLRGGYTNMSGTSMAAPHVAGLLLLGTNVCGAKKVINDPDGVPDPILTVYNAAEDTDMDGDGFTTCQGDLNDNDATIKPGATEICDGKDNDCDGLVDEGNVCCPNGAPSILYVNANATGGNDGLSWASAFVSLQSAISLAMKCSVIGQIWVAKGTYYPTADELGITNPPNVRTKTFTLRRNLTIYGGLAGNEPVNFDLSQRNFVTNEVILDGDIQQDNDPGNNAYNVVRITPFYGQEIDQTAIVDGVTIRNGRANVGTEISLDYPFSFGGGIMNFDSKAVVRNTKVINNYGHFGGGIANLDSDVSLINNWYHGNSAISGAGVVNDGSATDIMGGDFQLNVSTKGGSAMANYGAPAANITNVSISGGKTTSSGGAIFNQGSSPNIKNSVIWGNSYGIYNEPASGTVAASNPQITYSIVQDLTTGARTLNLNTDPKFVSQPAVGSTTYGNLALQSCSPALNVGDPALTSSQTGSKDLARQNRVYGSAIDIGAYELQSAPFEVNTTASPGSTVASGTPVTITASGASSYSWSTGETTASITVTPSATTTYTVTGTTGGCSDVVSAIITVGALPVELISFSAKAESNNRVKLIWETAREKDNAYFELEKSTDTKQNIFLTKVDALPMSDQRQTYSFVDESPFSGVSYYRLRQVDLNGGYKNYAWVSVKLNGNYMIFPNPLTDRYLQVFLDEPLHAKINVTSLTGRTVNFSILDRATSSMRLKLPEDLASGVYLLKVEERGRTYTHKVVVK